MSGSNSLEDDKILYWRKGDAVQNFGDFLSEIFIRELFTRPKVKADRYRLIGSVIAEHVISDDLISIRKERERAPSKKLQENPVIAFWGCGARNAEPLPPELLSYCRFYAVRGPLTRDLLGLPKNTVLGDPGLLLPLFHRGQKYNRAGPSICVPHFQDEISEIDLLKVTGADEVVSIKIPPRIDAAYELIDRITSASFVLTGALHAAIIACAYNVPFAYLDTGFVDCPFKWRDFSASLSVPALFVKNINEGKIAYNKIAAAIRKPRLKPLIGIAPFRSRMYQHLSARIRNRNS